MNIGILGMGIIGTRLAARWRQAGHAVAGWNRTRRDNWPADVARLPTPAAIARASEAIVIVVADPPALRQVLAGPDGVAAAPLAGKTILNASTVDASSNRRAEATVRTAGGAFLETPFTGSKDGAESGRLVFYAGGDAADVRRMEPLLLQVGARVLHFGPVGAAADVKLAMNLMLANQMAAMAEGFAFIERAGIPLAAFVEAYQLNAGWSGLAAMKAPKIMARDFSPHFSVKHMAKDVRLALARGAELDADLPHTRHVATLFAAALEQGLGEEDFSALYRALRPARGLTP